MQYSKFDIVFYETEDGRFPAAEFIKSQDSKMRAKIYRTLELLEDNGTALRMPYSEYLDDGIFQLRAKVGNNISRILYFFKVGKEIILTNGFVKKTQKTPTEEIALAKKYRADFFNRLEETR